MDRDSARLTQVRRRILFLLFFVSGACGLLYQIVWLRLAFADEPRCEIDAQEIERAGVSYTIDTVRDYAARFPEAELFYLIGADHVPTLPEWREAAALADAATFVVVPRSDGSGETEMEFPEPFRGTMLRGEPMAISASDEFLIRCGFDYSLPGQKRALFIQTREN